MKIAVVGTGYVGLVVGACLADQGNRVTCLDVDDAKVAMLTAGQIPFHEPGLAAIVSRTVKSGRLRFTTDAAEAVPGAQIAFIAVGTPASVDGSSSQRFVLQAARDIADGMDRPLLVVVKSTVPVGTCERIAAVMSQRTSHKLTVAMNPEFLSQGRAVQDFQKPQRIVVGLDDVAARPVFEDLYAPFMRTSHRLQFMDVRSAEITKYAANVMLAVRISMMNDLANFCERAGANVEHVRRGIAADDRIGDKFLFPGCGYGGSCFPKDVQAMIAMGRDLGNPMEILEACDRVNGRQRKSLAMKVLKHFDDDVHGRKIAIWGLSFKPNTDDIREAPSTIIIEELLQRGANIVAYDPQAIERSRQVFGDRVTFVGSAAEAAESAEALLIVTEWSEFRAPDLVALESAMKTAVVFDGRNVLDPKKMARLGFTYYSIGRPMS